MRFNLFPIIENYKKKYLIKSASGAKVSIQDVFHLVTEIFLS